jgi:hypothetical protein
MTQRQHHSPASFLLALLVVGSVASVTQPVAAAEPSDATTASSDRPRVLYRQAEAAFSAGRFAEARRLLLEAWNIRPSYDVAAALGQAELELKLYRDAAEHLDYAVQHFAPMESEQLLNGTRSDLRLAKSQVVEARVTVSEEEARVTIDGRPVGESPLPASIFLDPGSYTFEATVRDGRRVTKPLVLQKGGTYDVALHVPPAPQTPRSSGSPPRSDAPSYLPPAISAAIGGAALITGVGLLLAASSKDSSREDLLQRLPGSNRCGAGNETSAECAEISDLAWDASRFRIGASVAFGTAVAAGVLTYLLWPHPRRDQAGLLLSPSYSYETRSLDLNAIGRF